LAAEFLNSKCVHIKMMLKASNIISLACLPAKAGTKVPGKK